MASIEEIRRISIIASTQGVDAAKTSLDQLAASQNKVASSASDMGGSTLSAANKVEGLRRAHDAAYASQRKLEAGQRTVATALNQGGISAEMAAGTLLALERRYGAVGAAADVAAKAHNVHAASMGNSRMAAMELEHSVRAVADALAAGANPMRVFSMEFGRLAEASSMSGGFGNMLRGAGAMFAPMLAPLLSPLGILGGLGIGAGALGAYAFTGYQSRLLGLQTSLNGNGRATGLTLGGLNNLALGSAGGLTSSDQAQEAVAALAASGRIPPDMMQQLVGGGTIQQFGRSTGVGFGEATKALAADFADPTKGAAELNKQFGLLGDSQLQMIMHLDAGGDRLGAQGVLLDALNNRIKTAADVTSIWGKAWEVVANAAGNAVGFIGRAVSAASPEEALAAAIAGRQQRAAAAKVGASWDFFNDPATENAQLAEEKRLRDVVANNALAASWPGLDQIAKEKSLDIGEITRRAIPDIGARQGILDERNRLRDAMGTPGALAQAGVSPAQAQEAFGRLNYGYNNYATPAQRITQDSSLSAQATQASTAQERVAIEAHKAWIDVMRSSHDATEAAAASTAKWNEAIAQTQHALDDQARQSGDTAAMAGMKPYQRGLQEIFNRHRDFDGNANYGPLAMLDGMTALDTGGGFSDKGLINYAHNIAPKITSAAGRDALWNNYMSASGTPAIAATHPAATWPSGGVASAASAAPGWPASTSIGGHARNQVSLAQDIASYNTDQISVATRDAGEAIEAQNRLLQAQKDTWGKMPGPIAEALEKAKLYNEEIAKGVPITSQLLAANQKVATQAGAQAGAQATFQLQSQQIDQLNDMARSFTSGSLGDIANEFSNSTSKDDVLNQLSRGQQAAYYTGHLSLNQARMDVAKRQIQQLASKTLVNFGIGEITKGLFGSGSVGSPGAQQGIFSGLFGGLAGGLFGLGGGGSTYGGGAPDFSSGIGIFHSGGIVGGLAPASRMVDMSIFSGAPRFHDGGLVAGERPIIARDGEGVFTAQQMKAMGGGGGTVIHHSPQSTVIVQGSADQTVLPMIKAAIAENNATQTKVLQRTINQVTSKNSQLYA